MYITRNYFLEKSTFLPTGEVEAKLVFFSKSLYKYLKPEELQLVAPHESVWSASSSLIL